MGLSLFCGHLETTWVTSLITKAATGCHHNQKSEASMATEMFAIFREVMTPGFPDESFVVVPIMSDTPDSPDEIPGTRHWIEAIVSLECARRNWAIRGLA